MKLQEKKCGKYNLYAFDESFFSTLEKISRKEYIIEEELKNDYRSYVIKINCDDKSYILKKILFKRKRKKYLTFFRKGDCLKALLNVKEMRDKGNTELINIHGVGIYKKGVIRDQFMVMDYGIGRAIDAKKDYHIVEAFLKRLHSGKRCHGDVHPHNFLMGENNSLIALDTVLKKISLGDYRAHRDMIRFKESFGEDTEYPYKKSIYYWYCYFKKKFTGRL